MILAKRDHDQFQRDLDGRVGLGRVRTSVDGRDRPGEIDAVCKGRVELVVLEILDRGLGSRDRFDGTRV